jgi:hypothetical protein
MPTTTCRNCGGRNTVRHGLCAQCREHGRTGATRMPRPPDLEPMHDRPWVARSAFTGRTRRSPRT